MQEYVPMDNLHSYLIRKNLENLYISVAYKEVEKLHKRQLMLQEAKVHLLLTINTFNTTDLSLIFLQTPFLAFHYIFIGDTAVHFITLFSFCLVTSGGIKGAQFFFHV